MHFAFVVAKVVEVVLVELGMLTKVVAVPGHLLTYLAVVDVALDNVGSPGYLRPVPPHRLATGFQYHHLVVL